MSLLLSLAVPSVSIETWRACEIVWATWKTLSPPRFAHPDVARLLDGLSEVDLARRSDGLSGRHARRGRNIVPRGGILAEEG